MTETAPVNQVYGGAQESAGLLPMNDMGVDSGYILYETLIEVSSENPILVLENVRDYAAVYIEGGFQGDMDDGRKSLELHAEPGTHTLRIYVENIGRITYGPEILDNSKGLFGIAKLDGEEIMNWIAIPLEVRECDVDDLDFAPIKQDSPPCFYRGTFDTETVGNNFLDVSGWGMGEVWINGHYLGSFWEKEKQQSISIPDGVMEKKGNRIVVFEMKDKGARTMKLTGEPVFE